MKRVPDYARLPAAELQPVDLNALVLKLLQVCMAVKTPLCLWSLS